MLDPANTSTSSAVQQAIWQSFGDLGIEIPYRHQVEISQGGQEPQGAPQRGGDVDA